MEQQCVSAGQWNGVIQRGLGSSGRDSAIHVRVWFVIRSHFLVPDSWHLLSEHIYLGSETWKASARPRRPSGRLRREQAAQLRRPPPERLLRRFQPKAHAP